MSNIFRLPLRRSSPVLPAGLLDQACAPHILSQPRLPLREPVATQIRNYYTLLQTDYVVLQRQAALARVQQALEPLTAAVLSSG